MKVYEPGSLGVAEGVTLIFTMVMSRVFVSSIALQISEDRQLLWFVVVIDNLITWSCLYMMLYASNYVPGNIVAVCRKLVGGTGTWIILSMYSVMYLANSAILLREYAEYTLLTALPKVNFQMVILWYVLTIGILCYLGMEAFSRAGYILLPVLIGGSILVFIMLSPFYVIYHLTPWQGNGIIPALQSGVSNVGYNLGVMALAIMSPIFQNHRTIKKIAVYSLGGTGCFKAIFIIVYIMVFGTIVGAEKSIPFFDMARLVYLNQYIQRVEALFIVVWVIVGLVSIASSLYVGLYLITVLCKLPVIRPIIPLGVMIIANIAMLPPDVNYVLTVDAMLVKTFRIGIYLFPSILFVMAVWHQKRQKGAACIKE